MAREEDVGWVDRWGALLLSLVVLVGVAGLVLVARQAARANPRFQVDPRVVSVVAQPAWLPDELARQVAASLGGGLDEPASLLASGDLERWAGDLPDLSAWVKTVSAVRPRFPGQAEVRLQLRRPVLSLPGDVLLAADGEHLGRGVLHTLPRPLRLVGSVDAADARECAAAAGELLPWREALTELGVEVDRVTVGAGGRVVFLTEPGVELEWGRSGQGSEFAAVDLPPESRVAHLHDVLNRHPGLFGVQRVVLWKDRPEVVLSP